MYEVERQRGLRSKPPLLLPPPQHINKREFELIQLCPICSNQWCLGRKRKGSRRRGNIGMTGEIGEGHFPGNPGEEGGGVDGALGMMKASQLACWSPRTTSSAVDPAAWGCGRRSPGSCRVLPQEAACSSSWPLPCCNLQSQNTFAV